MNKWGFLRETEAKAKGCDELTGMCRTGLDTYLKVIFPEIEDWKNNKELGTIEGKRYRCRPDYRSEKAKLIVEHDGATHYNNPKRIKSDMINTKTYEEFKYKVVRIPFFIQLTKDAVKTLFDREVEEDLFPKSTLSFPNGIPSLRINKNSSPAYFCPAGIKRMAEEFRNFPRQYEANINYLKELDDPFETGVEFLEKEYKKTSKFCNCKNMILLNDILNFQNLEKVKIRFNLMFADNWKPIEIFKNRDFDILLDGQYWNYPDKKSYRQGQTTIGFIKISSTDDLWLLFHIGRITKDLDKLDGVGYEFETILEYEKYFGRLIVKYKNKATNMVRLANSVINDCEVVQILPETFDNDIFPGYDNVNVDWKELSRVIDNATWNTALKNQKGIYLITDSQNGKMYIGSAYGEQMILGRWKSYIKNGNGGNVELKKMSFDYIKENFRYSILEIFKSTTDDQTIIERENWWKELLQTRKFGYNKN